MADKKTRSIKVIEQSGYKYKPTPTIILKGQWLEEMGFEIGTPVKVECEDNRLVISVDTERIAEQAFMEEEMKKLTAQFEKSKKKLRNQYVAEPETKYGT